MFPVSLSVHHFARRLRLRQYGKQRFSVVPIGAILQRPPAPPGTDAAKACGVPCWRALATVYLHDGKATVPPKPVGVIRAYDTEFEQLAVKMKVACALVRQQERGRRRRALVCGDHEIALGKGGPDGAECSGMFFLDLAEGGTPRRL